MLDAERPLWGPAVRKIVQIGTATLLLVFGSGVPIRAQPTAAPLDLFSAHFGGSRQPVRASGFWGGASVLSLTQFDGRWREGAVGSSDPATFGGEFEQYGGLETTVGYVYATLGGSWLIQDVPLPREKTLAVTLSGSVHLGETTDSPPRFIQDRIHDLLGTTHVYRDHVSDTVGLLGVNGEILAWPAGRVSGHLALGLAGALGNFHQELGARVHIMDVRISGLRAGASIAASWVPDPCDLEPERVAPMIRSGWYGSLALTLAHPQVGGVQLTHSSNIYREQPEFLASFFVDAPFDSRWRLRAEFVNDLPGRKDRGPTGGGRFFLSRGG